ncbi:unnamed protein product [Caenorhabditis brenneri]
MSMSEKDQKELQEGTKKGIDILNGVSTVGKASLEFLKNEKVQTGIKNSLGSPDSPLVKQMQEMANKIELLGERVSTNFDEMKALITEINFFARVLSPTFNLTRFMRDCFRHPGADAKETFLKYYEKNPPLKLAFNFLTYLEQECTNPLKLAMNAEKPKSKETFDKWVDIFSKALGQFMIIEAFAAGLQGHKKDLLNIGFLFEVTIEIFDKVHKWKKEYTEGQDEMKNWEDVSKFVEELPKKHPNLTNTQVADKVEKKLNFYFWSLPMYLIVFDKSKEDIDYHVNVSSNDPLVPATDLIIKSWEMKDWNGCNIIIYQSLLAISRSEDNYKEIKKEVQNCKTGKLSFDGSVKDIIKNQLVEKRHLSRYSFGALISDGTHPKIRAVNSGGHIWGPGWWVKADVKDVQDGKKNNTLHYFLIVSF